MTCAMQAINYFHSVNFQASALHDKGHYLHIIKKHNTAIITLIHLALIHKDMRYAKNMCISSAADLFYRKDM